MSKPLTPAQLAQQKNRNLDGTYRTKYTQGETAGIHLAPDDPGYALPPRPEAGTAFGFDGYPDRAYVVERIGRNGFVIGKLVADPLDPADDHIMFGDWNSAKPTRFAAQVARDIASRYPEIPCEPGHVPTREQIDALAQSLAESNTPEDIGRVIDLADGDSRILEAAAANPHAQAEQLERLAQEAEDLPRRAWYPEDRPALERERDRIYKRIVDHPNTSQDALERIARTTGSADQAYRAIARMTPEARTALARATIKVPGEYDNLKTAFARRSDTPGGLLHRIACSGASAAPIAIAHPNLPKDTLADHVGTRRAGSREAAAYSPNLTEQQAERLVSDPVRKVAIAAASNPNIPTALARRTATSHPDAKVRLAALANPAQDPELLRQAAASDDKEAHEQVASNPSCPADILEQMAKGRKTRVREAARATLQGKRNTPREVPIRKPHAW